MKHGETGTGKEFNLRWCRVHGWHEWQFPCPEYSWDILSEIQRHNKIRRTPMNRIILTIIILALPAMAETLVCVTKCPAYVNGRDAMTLTRGQSVEAAKSGDPAFVTFASGTVQYEAERKYFITRKELLDAKAEYVALQSRLRSDLGKRDAANMSIYYKTKMLAAADKGGKKSTIKEAIKAATLDVESLDSSIPITRSRMAHLESMFDLMEKAVGGAPVKSPALATALSKYEASRKR